MLPAKRIKREGTPQQIGGKKEKNGVLVMVTSGWPWIWKEQKESESAQYFGALRKLELREKRPRSRISGETKNRKEGKRGGRFSKDTFKVRMQSKRDFRVRERRKEGGLGVSRRPYRLMSAMVGISFRGRICRSSKRTEVETADVASPQRNL